MDRGTVQEPHEVKDLEQKEKMKRVTLVWRHMLLNLIVLVAPFQSRNAYVTALAGGDIVKAAAWQSYMSAGAGIVEFLLNPACGRLSDCYGRKVFMLLSPFVNLITKLLVVMTDGRSLALVALDRVLGGAITTVGGSTTCAAAISDMVHGPELAGALGNLGSYAGMGVLIGPFISGQIQALTGRVQHTYMFGAVVAAIQVLYNSLYFTETLQSPKPMDFAACNPLSFVKVFQGDRIVSQLTFVAGMQCFPEGKSLADVNVAHISNFLKFPQQLVTVFVMSFGSCMVLAGKLPRLLIAKDKVQLKEWQEQGRFHLSQRNFTSISNWLTIVGLSMWATTKNKFLFLATLLILGPSMERRAATSALATDHAAFHGMGKGEFSGCFANWRALTVAFAPLLYGMITQRVSKRVPGAAYFTAAFIMVLTELCFRSIPPHRLELQQESKS